MVRREIAINSTMKLTFALVNDDSPDRVNRDKQAFKDLGEIRVDVDVERLHNKTPDQTRQDNQESPSRRRKMDLRVAEKAFKGRDATHGVEYVYSYSLAVH